MGRDILVCIQGIGGAVVPADRTRGAPVHSIPARGLVDLRPRTVQVTAKIAECISRTGSIGKKLRLIQKLIPPNRCRKRTPYSPAIHRIQGLARQNDSRLQVPALRLQHLAQVVIKHLALGNHLARSIEAPPKDPVHVRIRVVVDRARDRRVHLK